MRAALVAIAVALVLGAAAAPAHATPGDDLDKARQVYRGGQYAAALPLFNALLYPPPPRLASHDELTGAYLALGVCRFETGDPAGAKREFEQALALDPASAIDPLIVSDPNAIQAFNETKLDMRARARAEADAKHRAELLKIRESMVGIESHSPVWNLAPFGLGQFQNGENVKGTLFAVGEGLAFATSFGIWYALVNEYGIRSTHVPRDDGPTVRHLEQVEIGTGVAFFALWLYSSVDAYRHYRPQTRVELDNSALPPELRDLDRPRAAPKPKPGAATSILMHLAPIITQNSGGIGLAWEN